MVLSHGSSGKDKLGLPEAQSKTWLVDRSFWQSWEQKNEPQCIPPGKCNSWVCIEEEPVWGTEVTYDRLHKSLDICFSEQMKVTQPKGDAPLRQCILPRQDKTNNVLEGVQLMTCDYIKGTAGHYMPLESFSNFGKCERTIAIIRMGMGTSNTHPSTWPHHNPNKRQRVTLVSGTHEPTNPMYQFAGLMSRLQCCRLSTTKNAYFKFFQNGMNGPC